MATTYANLVAALEAMSVTGVVRTYTQGPPQSISTADLPAMFVSIPVGGEEPLLAKSATWATLRADVVMVYEPMNQNTPGANFDGTITAMDNLVTALRSLSIGQRAPSWQMQVQPVSIGQVDYWAIIATVETEG